MSLLHLRMYIKIAMLRLVYRVLSKLFFTLVSRFTSFASYRTRSSPCFV